MTDDDRNAGNQDTTRAIARAKALQEAGDFRAAADAYRAILGVDPALPKVLDRTGADALRHQAAARITRRGPRPWARNRFP